MRRILLIVNLFLFLVTAPLVGLYLAARTLPVELGTQSLSLNPTVQATDNLKKDITGLKSSIHQLEGLAVQNEQAFKGQEQQLSLLESDSSTKRKFSDDLYEQRILKMLGPAIGTHLSDRVEIKIFKLDELGYRGFIAKVKLFDPTAMKVVLGKGKLGQFEITSAAAKRTHAVLAINAGGFYKETKGGTTYARLIGNTIINGKLVEPFNGYPGNLFFAGIDRTGKVVGNVPQTQQQLMSLKPYMGVSFIPILLQNGQKMTIPEKWITTKQPRTMIGQYANGDLIFIVIDGRRNDWSVGITLERLQDKLLQLGVRDAYNLDGGGSTAMYFKGQILNKPSDGKERPVVNNIVILP